MRSKILVLLYCIMAVLGSQAVSQSVATHLDLMGNMPENYKAFVVVNKYGYALAPEPVKYVKGKPCPALVLLNKPDLAGVNLNMPDGARNFKLVLPGEESLRGLFIPSDRASKKLIFTELKFVTVNPRIFWQLVPVKGTKYCRIVSLADHSVRAATDEDGNLIKAIEYCDGDQWELIRVK